MHRSKSETSSISFCGYLLKRSNYPHADSFTGASIDGLLFLDADESVRLQPQSQIVADIASDTDAINAPSQLPQHWIEVKKTESEEKKTESEEKETEWMEGKTTTKSQVERSRDNTASFFGLNRREEEPVTDTAPVHQSPVLVSPTTPSRPKKSAPISVKSQSDNDALRFLSRQDSAPTFTQICDGTAPPADYVDPKDGHIWRARYCVLEEGILYFYRNANDGESQEAKLERRKSVHLYATTPRNTTPEDEDLSKSPTPSRRLVNSLKPETVAIYEKHVFLDRVGKVRSTQEYGECSFELLAVEVEDCNAKSKLDKLVLRARNSEEMRDWLLQFHRYLASLMKNIIETVGGGMTAVGDIHHPSLCLQNIASPAEDFDFQAGPLSLSHGHGQSALRRKRVGGLKGSPWSTPRGSPSQLTPFFGQVSYVTADVTPAEPKRSTQIESTARGDGEMLPKLSRPPEALPATERPPTRPETTASYFPDETIGSTSFSAHVEDFQLSAPDHYGAFEGAFEMIIDEPQDQVLEGRLHRIGHGTVETPGRPFSPFMLGGCADRRVVNGSILDPMFKSRSASKLGQVLTEDYGGFGGGKHAKDANGFNVDVSLKWEIGAVSKCGERAFNEDSYLVASDLMKGFESLSADQNDFAYLPTWAESGSHQPGLFCIFDGHNGNHAARFAAEKLPHFLLEESRVNSQTDGCSLESAAKATEEILLNAIGSLDDAFCRLCTEGGRDWDSGSTALIALVAHEHLVLANVGDCRGVMCHSMDAGNDMKDGWSKFEHTEDATKDATSCFFRQVNTVHSPSRPDEHERIREANGWITVEIEIPTIVQLQKMHFEDEDVRDIVKRCFKDRNCSSSAPQRIIEISRVCGDLAVSRALGDRDYKAAFNDSVPSSVDFEWHSPMPFLPYPNDHSRHFTGDLVSSVPELQRLKLAEKGVYNEFLLLACDGLWDVMDPDDAVRITRGLLYEKKWEAKLAAARLAELAIHLGSSDNVTVIVVRFFTED
jgi:serine/threonine protein phosphatase PrpC